MENKKDYPIVSIITLNWNEADDLSEMIDSVRKLDYPKNRVEIIVSDNGSDDFSVNKINEKYAEMDADGFLALKMIENKENLGVTGALNKAFQSIDKESKYIIRTDNDIVLSNESVRKSVEEMEKNSKIGLLGGRIFYYNKDNRNIPTEFGAIFFSLYLGKNITVQSDKPIECDAIMGCYSIIRRDAVNFPLYDDNFFVYSDDIDCCLCIKKKGYKIVYDPGIKIWHKVAKNFDEKQIPKAFLYYSFRNRFLLIKKHANINHKIIFYPVYFLLMIRFFVLSLLAGKLRESKIRLKAVKDAVFNRWGRQII